MGNKRSFSSLTTLADYHFLFPPLQIFALLFEGRWMSWPKIKKLSQFRKHSHVSQGMQEKAFNFTVIFTKKKNWSIFVSFWLSRIEKCSWAFPWDFLKTCLCFAFLWPAEFDGPLSAPFLGEPKGKWRRKEGNKFRAKNCLFLRKVIALK